MRCAFHAAGRTANRYIGWFASKRCAVLNGAPQSDDGRCEAKVRRARAPPGAIAVGTPAARGAGCERTHFCCGRSRHDVWFGCRFAFYLVHGSTSLPDTPSRFTDQEMASRFGFATGRRLPMNAIRGARKSIDPSRAGWAVTITGAAAILAAVGVAATFGTRAVHASPPVTAMTATSVREALVASPAGDPSVPSAQAVFSGRTNVLPDELPASF
jgi:hypothetical protein